VSKLTIEQELEIINIKKEKSMTNLQIMEKFNIKSTRKIYDIIIRNGREHLKSNKKTYSLNENYFENIDTEDKAYWLGFLYADGCVYFKQNIKCVLRIKLKNTEKYHIDLFNKCLNSNHPIKSKKGYILKNNKKYNFESVEVSISNVKIVKDLINHGCMPNKTFKLEFPNLDEKLMKHFIRGYFDGDGCICKRKDTNNSYCISIIGNENFTKSLQKYLCKKFNSDKIYNYKNGNIKVVTIMNNKECIDFKNFIYENATIYLDRKKKIFEQIILK
jgi:hypothetical protein